ncbi:MAG: zinc ribbon domain-containing protein [Gammaproteobacteria bacterium]|nr:zinc ribbon domain-containing protein [Gammaproteobacteria bacterium]
MSTKLTSCKACNAEVSKSAKKCPNCGEKLKSKKWLLIAISLVLLLIVIAGVGTPRSMLISGEKPSIEDYSNVKVLEYRKALVGDYDKGTKLAKQGKIMQIINENSMLIKTKYYKHIGYDGDIVWLELESTKQYVKGDVVRLLGRYIGTYEYESAFNIENKVPVLQVDHIDIWSER